MVRAAAALGKGRILVSAAILCAACAVFSVHPVASNDAFWHVACGRLMRATGRVPRVDEFTFTCAGNPWVNHEYLADLAFAAVDGLLGPEALVLITLAAACACAFLFRRAACIRSPNAAAWFPVIFAAALFALVPRLLARPHVFSLAASGVLYLILVDFERGGRRLMWALPPLLWLWAQMHGAFLMGLVFLGMFCARMLLARDARKVVPVMALSPLLLLLGPYGPETFTFPLKLLGAPTFMRYIAEWQPLFGGAPLAQPWCHALGMALAAAGIAAAVVLKIRGKGSAWEILWLLLLAVLALKMRRAIAYPVLAATVPLARFAADRWARLRPELLPAPLLLGFVIWGIPTGPGEYQAVRFGIAPNIPVQAADFLVAHGVTGNAYNSYTFGGYLTYRSPEIKTSIDSRNLVYSESFFMHYYQTLRQAEPEASLRHFRDDLLARATLAVFAAPALPDATAQILDVLARDPDWELVYFDDAAFVYLKKSAHPALLADLRPFRRLAPHTLQPGPPSGPEAQEAIEEARYAVALAPHSAAAWVLLGRAALQRAAGAAANEPVRTQALLESRAAFLRALSIPGMRVPADTYLHLARIEARAGDVYTALRYAEQCLAREKELDGAARDHAHALRRELMDLARGSLWQQSL